MMGLALSILACNPTEANHDQWKQDVIDTEKSFAAMALDKDIATAFLAYAADDAVLSRNNQIISGREKIQTWFESRSQSDGATLVWEPEFVDVSEAGDMAYTYGTYTFTILDSLGNSQQSSGVFHTVWKRQQDGKWKFVWD